MMLSLVEVSSTFLTALTGTFALLISHVIYNLYFHPLRSFPGPWYSKVNRVWYSYHAARKTSLSAIRRLHDEYGDVVRIAPNELSYSTGEAWKPIYGGAIQSLSESKVPQARGLLPKDPVLYGAGFEGTEALTDAEGSTYSAQRRALGHAFTRKAALSQMPMFSSYIDRAFEKLKTQLSVTDTVDLGPLFGNAIFDFNIKWALDRDIGASNAEGRYHPSIEFVESVMRHCYIPVTLRRIPLVGYLLDTLQPVLNRGFLHFNIIGPLVQERLEEGGCENDLVSYMQRPKTSKAAADHTQIINNATIFISTGTGTTAPLICAAVYYILSYPAIHSTLRDEIRNAATNVSELTMDLLNNMTYLKAVMTEAIRLYPPVAGTLPRLVPKGGVDICGQFIPEGTVVGVHHFATYRSARNFKYPEEFRPERWLEGADGSGEFEGDCREALQPFSVGPRKCIAYELANMSSKMFVARLFWEFELELDERSRGWGEQRGYIQFQKGPLMVRAKRREDLKD